MLTRIKTNNILDRQVFANDLADGAVTFEKIAGLSGGLAGQVLKTNGFGDLFWEAATGSSTALTSLTDVDIVTVPPIHGDSLVYNSGTLQWEPGSNVPSSLSLNTLIDVTLGSLQQNQFLRYDPTKPPGQQWHNAFVSMAYVTGKAIVALTGLLGDLDNVNVTGATTDQRLGFDGSQWRAVNAAELSTIDAFLDVDTTTVAPVNGDALAFNGTLSQWVPQAISGLGASSNTSVVADITARNLLSPAGGDQAFVRSGVTAGEWEMYLWDAGAGPAAWVLIATQDGAATDARTIAGDIDVTTISPVLLGNVSAGSRVTLVSIDVSVAFDGAPVLTVGTDGSPTTNTELASDAELDLSVVGTYTIVTDVEYDPKPVPPGTWPDGIIDTDIKAYFAVGGATVGNARVLVTYV